MSLNTFDIRQLVANHYIAPTYPDFVVNKIVDRNISITDIGESFIKNDLGMPYFMDLYCKLPGIGFVPLPHEPLIKLDIRKNIVKTVTAGGKRKGTVKEYISADDYQVDIKGVCIDLNAPERYPAEQVLLVRKLAELNDSIEVMNPILALFGIYNIVVESASYADMAGVPGAQAYHVRAVSDEDFYAKLKGAGQITGS